MKFVEGSHSLMYPNILGNDNEIGPFAIADVHTFKTQILIIKDEMKKLKLFQKRKTKLMTKLDEEISSLNVRKIQILNVLTEWAKVYKMEDWESYANLNIDSFRDPLAYSDCFVWDYESSEEYMFHYIIQNSSVEKPYPIAINTGQKITSLPFTRIISEISRVEELLAASKDGKIMVNGSFVSAMNYYCDPENWKSFRNDINNRFKNIQNDIVLFGEALDMFDNHIKNELRADADYDDPDAGHGPDFNLVPMPKPNEAEEIWFPAIGIFALGLTAYVLFLLFS